MRRLFADTVIYTVLQLIAIKIRNRSAWELLPKWLAGSKSHAPKGGIHSNSRSGNHPKKGP